MATAPPKPSRASRPSRSSRRRIRPRTSAPDAALPPTSKRHLALAACTRSRHQLAMTFHFDGLRFHTTYWYGDVDLLALEARYGRELMEKIYFHIAAFEINKLCSLAPATVDFGRFSRFVNPAFESLWTTLLERIWAQWRYENELPDYAGPRFVGGQGRAVVAPVAASPNTTKASDVEILSFCGGGKDSLVAMKLLERGGLPFASFAYARSEYGNAAAQHQLIDRLLDHGVPQARHKMWVVDDFPDSPVLALCGEELGVRSITLAETPSSLFAALPLLLAHGYRYLALAHERSADTGNLVWQETGEEVNHQWGKSYEAEALLDDYLRRELITNGRYFSLLKPIHDAVIFTLLQEDLAAVGATHSCNVRKPWCCRCPKCAYVWLGYMAYLPTETVAEIFSENLFDLPENVLDYRRLLGLEERTPFECVGEVAESRLAFELCRRKGVAGRAVETYCAEVAPIAVQEIVDTYLQVHAEEGMPEAVAARVIPQLQAAAQRGRAYVERLLGSGRPEENKN